MRPPTVPESHPPTPPHVLTYMKFTQTIYMAEYDISTPVVTTAIYEAT